MKRILLGAAVALVLIAAIGVFTLLSNLDSLVAQVIETQGTKVVGTRVAVSGVSISLRDGRATIAGLSVASPDGYDARDAFTLGEITVDIDPGSVRDEPIVIDAIRVLAPVVDAEFLETGASNIHDLQKNLQQFAASRGGGGDEGQPADQKRIRIKEFTFADGTIRVDASALGVEARTLNLPAIRLDDIGGAAGARPDEIAQAVLGALTRQAAAEIAKAGIEAKARDMVEDEAEKAAKGLLDKLGN